MQVQTLVRFTTEEITSMLVEKAKEGTKITGAGGFKVHFLYRAHDASDEHGVLDGATVEISGVGGKVK